MDGSGKHSSLLTIRKSFIVQAPDLVSSGFSEEDIKFIFNTNSPGSLSYKTFFLSRCSKLACLSLSM